MNEPLDSKNINDDQGQISHMSALLQMSADQWKIILAYVGKKVLQDLINIRGDLYPSYEEGIL